MTVTIWAIRNAYAGQTNIGSVDSAENQANPVGTIVVGDHPTYQAGEFIYLKGAANVAAGDVVTYDTYNNTTTRWDGTANTGKPLAVAVAATVAGQYGWFQISGATVVNVSGTVAAGDLAYFASTATVKTAQVNGKQVLGCYAVAASGTPATGQAVYQLQRPIVQSQTV